MTMFNLLHFYIAIGTFFLSVGLSVGFRLTSRSLAAQDMSWLHLVLVLIYITACAALQLPFGTDFWIGLLLYFQFHYVAFLMLFGIPRRSFSVNLLVILFENGGTATTQKLATQYGEGR